MNLKEQLNGIQHIGIPTNDIEATIEAQISVSESTL